MQTVIRKVMLSVFTVLFVLLTMITTTFAWIGILTYSSVESFDINIKGENKLKNDYFITISSTGEKDTFSDSINLMDIQKQILINRYDNLNYIDFDSATSEEINKFFQSKAQLSVTTTYIEQNKLAGFYELDYSKGPISFIPSKGYYKFDVYLTVDSREGISENTRINSNIFITELEDMLTGTPGSGNFIDGNPFKDMPSNPLYDTLKNIPNTFTVNSANAARVALEIYDPINIDSKYDETHTPTQTIIYQGGKNLPYHDDTTGIYDLGGNLPEDYNTAIQEIIKIRDGYDNMVTPIEILNRGDLEISKENSRLWSAPKTIEGTNYLGVQKILDNGVEKAIQTKMKITVYFWFEGYDADCLANIDKKPVKLNLTFTADMDELNS